MSTYLNANLRRTAIEENRFFQEIPRLNGLGLCCFRADIVKACRSSPSGQTNDAFGKGSPYQVMDFHGLRFRWFEGSDWSFTGPSYSILIKHTCGREDARTWLDGLFAAERSSRSLQRGPRFVHTLGSFEGNAEEQVVCSHRANEVIWRYLDNRLFSVRLATITAGTVEAVAIRKMILYWTARVPLWRAHP
jgi:hypothetical protein